MRDLAALRESVEALANESRRLTTQFPSASANVQERQSDIERLWATLSTNATTRKQKLVDSHDLQRFFNDVRNSVAWINDMHTLITSDDLGKDVASSDALLQRHKEHKGEIDAREDSFQTIVDFGNTLLRKGPQASEGVQVKLASLAAERKKLLEVWQKRQQQFEHSHDLQVFLRDAEQIDSWIAAQESTLASDDLGDSLDSVEALIKTHDDFEKSLAAQTETVKSLDVFATRLLGYNHYDSAAIKKRRDAVLSRRTRLDQLSSARRAKLDDSLRYQQFKRDAEEAAAWINEKLQTATDDSYRDPTNLGGKLQNHQAYEAELKANEGLITTVNATGNKLASARHYASESIVSRLASLNQQWKTLLDHSRNKGQKLKEANQHQQFSRRVEDIHAWCAEVRSALASDDFGRDLTGVQNLLKKHALLEAEIAGHKERIDAVAAQAKEFVSAGNFQAERIASQQKQLTAAYAALADPALTRRKKLEDALKLQQFFRDVDDEEAWIRDKVPVASSYNYGNSLTSVQNLIKKHAALRAELDGRIKRIHVVEEAAQSLVEDKHYASQEISTRLASLNGAWTELNQAAQQRQEYLDDSLRAQQYFTDSNETEAWMTEKEPIISNNDYGKDEDSAQVLLKKHEAVESDLQAYRGTIDTLAKQSKACKDLPTAGITRSVSTMPTMQSVKAKYNFKATREQEVPLVKGEAYELISKETADWWCVKSAGRTGYAPAAYLQELETESHAQLNTSTSSTGIEAAIVVRQEVLEDTYKKLLEKASFRRTKLEESQQLHLLNRECDEVTTLIQDREAIAKQQDVGNDLEHNEVIQKKFDEFLKDVAANETRVTTVNELANKFVQQGHSDAPVIQARRQDLNKRWHTLQELAANRNSQLLAAHEVHRFNRDVDETNARFNEKDVVLSIDDYGKDVPTVEALQRKHDGAVRDLMALGGKIDEIHSEAARLVKLHPENAIAIQRKVNEIDVNWEMLQKKAADRKAKLEDSLHLQKFLNDIRDLNSWIATMQGRASSEELASDAGGAEELLKRFQELKTEVEAHTATVEQVKEFGKGLTAKRHFASADIAEKLSSVDSQLQALSKQLAFRKLQLDQCKELQVYNRIAEQAEAWIATREPALVSTEIGASLDAVEAMQRKHNDFEKSLEAQREKIAEVEREAARLVAASHYDTATIAEKKSALGVKFVLNEYINNVQLSKLFQVEEYATAVVCTEGQAGRCASSAAVPSRCG